MWNLQIKKHIVSGKILKHTSRNLKPIRNSLTLILIPLYMHKQLKLLFWGVVLRMNIEVSKPKERSYSVVWWYGSITKAAFFFFFLLLSAGRQNQQQIQVLVAALKAKFSQI